MASDKQYRVVSAVGTDRPGLVNEITKLIHQAGANLEDSRMAALGGVFTVMILVSGEGGSLESLENRLQVFGDESGVRLSVTPAPGEGASTGLGCRLEVTGLDHPGIVHGITAALAQWHVNVDDLETKVVPAPMSGAPTFVLEAEVSVPPTVSMAKLRAALAEICEEENLDWSLRARPS